MKIHHYFLASLIAPTWAFAQTPIFVDENSPAGLPFQDGLSWATAFTDLQRGLDEVQVNFTATGEVLVAEGTYSPTTGIFPSDADPSELSARSFVFIGMRSIELHGGFLGSTGVASGVTPSTHPDQPDGKFFKTDLVGALSWTVIGIDQYDNDVDTAPSITIDGFEIRGGNSNGNTFFPPAPEESLRGGGIYARVNSSSNILFENLRITNCTANLSGGGVHLASAHDDLETAGPKVIIRECKIRNNYSVVGAGMTIPGGAIRMGNMKIFDNGSLTVNGQSAFVTEEGGGLHLGRETQLHAVNMLVYGNEAQEGGGIYLQPAGGNDEVDTNHRFINCTITGNRSPSEVGQPGAGAGVFVAPGSTFGPLRPLAGVRNVDFDNSIIWGNVGVDVAILGDALTNNGGVLGEFRYCNLGTLSDTTFDSGTATASPAINIAADPVFVNTAASNYRLRISLLNPGTSSPCIDAGSDSLRRMDRADVDGDVDSTELLPIDFFGSMRVIAAGSPASPPFGELIDMGAIETSIDASPSGF